MTSCDDFGDIDLELPDVLVDQVLALARERGHVGTTLWFHWLAEAAQLAARGEGYRLPRFAYAKYGSRGRIRKVRRKQSRTEYRRWLALYEASGSSVSTVARAAGQAYVDADGDLLVMEWLLPAVRLTDPISDHILTEV